MSQTDHHDGRSEDLSGVTNALREHRPELNPLELDRIKLRAMSGARRSSQQKGVSVMRSRMVAFLTVGMLALGTGTAAACVFNFGGGFTGVFGSEAESAAYHQYRPPCLPFFTPAANGQCVFDPLGAIWKFVENTFCWQSNGKGGFVWAKGNGWVLTI
jgi:hypothetical protein